MVRCGRVLGTPRSREVHHGTPRSRSTENTATSYYAAACIFGYGKITSPSLSCSLMQMLMFLPRAALATLADDTGRHGLQKVFID